MYDYIQMIVTLSIRGCNSVERLILGSSVLCVGFPESVCKLFQGPKVNNGYVRFRRLIVYCSIHPHVIITSADQVEGSSCEIV